MPISIGIPFYNAEQYLADAVRSVFAQSYQDWELILVDDGSSDRSLEIAQSVKDPRVRVVSDGENRRLPYRLNQIAAEAKYDYIGRMDADDIISPHRFEKQVTVFREHPEVDLVTTGVCSLTDDNRPVGKRCGSQEEEVTGPKLLLGQCAIVHAAMLYKKSWMLRNPYDETLYRTEDYELWLRAFSKKDFSCYIIDEPLYYYREEGSTDIDRLLSAYRSHRYLYFKYGYLASSKFDRNMMIAKTFLKSGVVRALSLFGQLDLLLDRRNEPIEDPRQKSLFDSEITQVLNTKVPGLD